MGNGQDIPGHMAVFKSISCNQSVRHSMATLCQCALTNCLAVQKTGVIKTTARIWFCVPFSRQMSFAAMLRGCFFVVSAASRRQLVTDMCQEWGVVHICENKQRRHNNSDKPVCSFSSTSPHTPGISELN